ncbi:MAG: acyl carrier protein [Xenococcaceae cyanobacterium MO_188.B29]|nr:acyl carrier protein [Xenococcaceae cyanobacterium MO_188.B29]
MNSSVSNQTAIANWLIQQLSEKLSLDKSSISVSEPLTRYGLDSIDAVTMVGDIEDILDVELPSTLFWDYPTIEKSSQFLADNYDVSAIAFDSDAATPEVVEEKVPEPVAAGKSKGWGGLFGRS